LGNTVIIVTMFVIGLLLIIKGGDWFVDSAVWIAEATHIPKFIIGATIVSIATTIPELTVSVTGVIDGELDMAVGNAVGSVSANIGLIMGISLVCIPSAVNRRQFWLKAVLMASAAGLLWLLCSRGELMLLPSLGLFVLLGIYIWDNIRDARNNDGAEAESEVDKKQLPKMLALFVLGIAAIILGSKLLINNGVLIAELLHVPSAIIGVTMVAIGTSLPELVTTVTAIRKKEASMSIGNIVGANVIDLALILPVCSIVSDGRLVIAEQSYTFDMPVCLGMALLAVIPPLITGKMHRWQGIAMLAGYSVYVYFLVAVFGAV